MSAKFYLLSFRAIFVIAKKAVGLKIGSVLCAIWKQMDAAVQYYADLKGQSDKFRNYLRSETKI